MLPDADFDLFSIPSTGLGNEAGLYLKKGLKASEDSHAIASMRASGAIPLAVTNTPELCLWLESSNTLFGRTSNPYNTKRTCGGSSGKNPYVRYVGPVSKIRRNI